MRLRPDHQQQELFEEEEPPIALSFEQRLQLLPLVQMPQYSNRNAIAGRG